MARSVDVIVRDVLGASALELARLQARVEELEDQVRALEAQRENMATSFQSEITDLRQQLKIAHSDEEILDLLAKGDT